MSTGVDQRAAGRPMARLGRLLFLICALLVIRPDDGHGAIDCASLPEDERWLRPLCEAIQEIAAGRHPGPIEVAGQGNAQLWRNPNGTAIDIDFNNNVVGSSVIARLLSGSAFIAPERIDLVVIRNASLTGPLNLSHATIEVAAEFHNVRFNPTARECDPAAPGRDALVLVGVEAKKRLAVRDSDFCGDVRIASSRLRGGLQLGRGPGGDDDGSGVDTRVPSLFVVKSNIEGELLIGPVQVARDVLFDRSTMDALTVVESEFAGPVEIVDNRLGALSVWSSTFDALWIADNAVASSMQLRVVRVTGAAPPSIRDNDINGGLTLTMREIAAGAADLSHNTVGRSTDIWLPQGWRGSLGLSNSVFRSRLALCQARYVEDTLHTVPAAVDPHLEGSCREPEQNPTGLFGVPSAMAAERDSAEVTTVNLRSVDAATLAWRLPLSCAFRWEGTGLRYRNWAETAPGEAEEASDDRYQCSEAPPSEPDTPLIGSTDGLMLMRHLMKKNDVDALNTMADYLERRGNIVESRDIRKEAKRANYLNIPEDASLLDEWSRWVASRILQPVGYGAKPEHALIWLFGIWLLSLLIYMIYSYTQHESWERSLAEQEKSAENLGYSRQPGFMQFDKEKDPKDFDIVRYSIDAMLPVINLHTYDRYYPQHAWLRFYSGVQHAFGWFLITIFLVSAAVL